MLAPGIIRVTSVAYIAPLIIRMITTPALAIGGIGVDMVKRRALR